MALNDNYRLALVGTGPGGQDMVVVQHYQCTAVGDTTSEQEVMEDLMNAWQATTQTAFLDIASSEYVLDRLVVQTKTVPPQGLERVVSEQGNYAGDPLPPQIAPMVVWKTPFLGRRYRGNNHLPVPTDAAENKGVWLLSYVSLVNTYISAALELTGGEFNATFRLVVYSNILSAGNLVTSGFLVPNARTMKSRTQGFGS